MKNKLYITFFCILTILGANPAKGAIAAPPHHDGDLQKYGQRPEFDATVSLQDFGQCSSSRVKIGDDDPIDFYITAAHCIPDQSENFFDKLGIGVATHPEKLDLAIFTKGEHSHHPKYPLYIVGDLNDLVGQRVTSVGYGMSLSDEGNSYKRQAFDATIGSIEPAKISVSNSLLTSKIRSTWSASDLNRGIEDNPIGMATKGDSGGSLLIKEKDVYKLAGATSSVPGTYEDPHHSWWTSWTQIDPDFIERAKKELLTKMAVYAHSSQSKTGFPIITFSLSNRNSLNETCPLETEEQYFIGYISPNVELIVLVDGEESFHMPLVLGYTHFIYQVGQKRYFIEVTIEKAEGKSFLVKGTILNEDAEGDGWVALNLADEVMLSDNECRNGVSSTIKIKPIYYTLFNKDNLPLEVSFHSYLPNKNFIDTTLLENKEILGYTGDSYDIVIRLNGREFKTFSNREIIKDDSKHVNQFRFQYAGNTYNFSIWKSEAWNKDHIYLSAEMISENLLYDSVESMSATTENFISIDLNPASENFGDENEYGIRNKFARIKLIKGGAIVDDKSNKISYYAKKGCQIILDITGAVVKTFSIDKEGCHYVTYKEDGVVYVIEVNIQKFNDPEERYEVGLTVKKLDGELVPANESCESEIGGVSIEYSLTEASKAIASDLNLIIVLDNMFPQSSLPEGCIGYGNEDSLARIFSGNTELRKFFLYEIENRNRSIEFEKNGKSYSMSLKALFEGNRWRILLDVNEIQAGGSFMTLMNWFK